jgi:hypothetical protein
LALGLAIYDNLVYNGNKAKRQYVKAIAVSAGTPTAVSPQEQFAPALRLPLHIVSLKSIIQCCVVDFKGIDSNFSAAVRFSAPVPLWVWVLIFCRKRGEGIAI